MLVVRATALTTMIISRDIGEIARGTVAAIDDDQKSRR